MLSILLKLSHHLFCNFSTWSVEIIFGQVVFPMYYCNAAQEAFLKSLSIAISCPKFTYAFWIILFASTK